VREGTAALLRKLAQRSKGVALPAASTLRHHAVNEESGLMAMLLKCRCVVSLVKARRLRADPSKEIKGHADRTAAHDPEQADYEPPRVPRRLTQVTWGA